MMQAPLVQIIEIADFKTDAGVPLCGDTDVVKFPYVMLISDNDYSEHVYLTKKVGLGIASAFEALFEIGSADFDVEVAQ